MRSSEVKEKLKAMKKLENVKEWADLLKITYKKDVKRKHLEAEILEKYANVGSSKKDDAKADSESDKPEDDEVRVFGNVNLVCKAGNPLKVGEFCNIKKAEYDRLKEDKRHKKSPFWRE